MKGYQFDLKLRVLKYLIRSEPTGDFINSEEYREPDWLVKMKELKKKLAGKFFSPLRVITRGMNERLRRFCFPQKLSRLPSSSER